MRFSEIKLDYGTSFVLPPLPMKQPLLCHPDVDQAESLSIDWMRSFLVQYFGDATIAERYLRHRPSLGGALSYPHTLPDRLFALMNSTWTITLLDDAFSKPHIQAELAACVQLRDELVAVLSGAPAHTDFAIGRLLRASLDQLAPGMTPTMIERSAECLIAIFDSCMAEARVRHDDLVPDLAAYLEPRRTNFYGYWATMLTEYALGLDLSAHLVASADLRLAVDLVLNHLVLVNDLFSFVKEYEQGEMMNAIWILCAQESLSLQQAVDRVAGQLAQIEDDFIATCVRVRASQPELDLYLHELGHMISGNLRFHRMTDRYRKTCLSLDDTSAGTATAQTVIIQKMGTVYHPITTS